MFVELLMEVSRSEVIGLTWDRPSQYALEGHCMDPEKKVPRRRFRGTGNGIRYSAFAEAFAAFQELDFEEVKKTEIAPDQRVAELFDDPVMWVELAEHLEDTFNLQLMDTDLWERLADQSSTKRKPIRDSLTFYRLWLFVSETPGKDEKPEEVESNGTYGELLANGDFTALTRFLITDYLPNLSDDDWELLPDSYLVSLNDVAQMQLFQDLDIVGRALDFDVDVDAFFGLFAEKAPTVERIIDFITEAYTAEIA